MLDTWAVIFSTPSSFQKSWASLSSLFSPCVCRWHSCWERRQRRVCCVDLCAGGRCPRWRTHGRLHVLKICVLVKASENVIWGFLKTGTYFASRLEVVPPTWEDFIIRLSFRCCCLLLSAFLGLHPWHMEGLRLGGEWELQLLASTTTTASQDPSRICDLHHSSQQHWILNPHPHGCWLGLLLLSHNGNFLAFFL